MIHETLFYLWKCPINTLHNTDWNNLFELQEFCHPGEQRLIQRIIDIAIEYHEIAAFTKSILNNTGIKPNDEVTSTATLPTGLYITAFCTGVNNVLKGYKQEIIRLEGKFLENPRLSLTYILSSAEKFNMLFKILKSMIQVIECEEVYGCLLMGRLHKYMYCGMDNISNAADLIIKSINTIFYRHLCNWIIYGDLVDAHNEFFIRDGQTADEDFLYPEQMLATASSMENVPQLFKKKKICNPPIVRKFYIDWNLVPMFINAETVESILFMGRIVWIVRNDPKKLNESNYQDEFKRDIWDGQDIEYYNNLHSLETESFNKVKFQETVEVCRLKLTKYLWSLMLDEGNLIEHLQLIRDYYALGRGELFQQFITVADEQMKDLKPEVMLQSLNNSFRETARKIYGENDKTYLRFELTAPGEIQRSNFWSRLQLNFQIKWPLHIVFHPKVMELYNKLFRFLLRLKKSQINLHRVWHDHISGKHDLDRRVWTLRRNIMFLVNNFQYYIQVDVIEAHFSTLLKAVQNANEFEDIIKVHHEFISNLLAQTFILAPDKDHKYNNKHCLYQTPAVRFDEPSYIYAAIVTLLELCDDFCLISSTWSPELNEPELEELDLLQKRSDAVTEKLFYLLSRYNQQVKGQHLIQLIAQLDFNKYFSKNRPDYNLTIM